MAVHLSPSVKLYLQEPAGDRVVAIAALKRAPTKADRERLAHTGCTLRGVAGDTVTLACDRAGLARLIEWDGVVSVDLSAPLYPE
jgi:hypothetical protein